MTVNDTEDMRHHLMARAAEQPRQEDHDKKGRDTNGAEKDPLRSVSGTGVASGS